MQLHTRTIDQRTKVLTKDFIFTFKGEQITIPAGYVWDGATAGGKLTRLLVGLNRFGEQDIATITHDFLYENEGEIGNFTYTRKEADIFFKEKLSEIRFKGTRLYLIFKTVRVCGFFLWTQF